MAVVLVAVAARRKCKGGTLEEGTRAAERMFTKCLGRLAQRRRDELSRYTGAAEPRVGWGREGGKREVLLSEWGRVDK